MQAIRRARGWVCGASSGQVHLAIGNAEQEDHVKQVPMDFADYAQLVLNDTAAAEMESADGVPYLAEVTDQWSKSEVVLSAAEKIVQRTLGAAKPFVVSVGCCSGLISAGLGEYDVLDGPSPYNYRAPFRH